jgi:hypothetical protein
VKLMAKDEILESEVAAGGAVSAAPGTGLFVPGPGLA